MIVVTGSTGNLGRHVLEHLAAVENPANIVATARSVEKLNDYAERGFVVRHLDYNDPSTVAPALEGATQVLLISGSEVGQRVPQHKAVIDGAVAAGVEHLAYTSLLKADTSSVGLAPEHQATEELLAATDLTTSRLRHGWYIENYTENLEPALANGAFIGSAGDGRIAGATRADYAAADAAVLLDKSKWGGTYELGGPAFTMADLAAAVSQATGRELPYVNMPVEEYAGALLGGGVPEPMANLLASADVSIAAGELDTDPSVLAELVGRPLTTLPEAVAAALGQS